MSLLIALLFLAVIALAYYAFRQAKVWVCTIGALTSLALAIYGLNGRSAASIRFVSVCFILLALVFSLLIFNASFQKSVSKKASLLRALGGLLLAGFSFHLLVTALIVLRLIPNYFIPDFLDRLQSPTTDVGR
jgi:hypothetical protein